MAIKPCKVCGFVSLRGEDFCYRHSKSERAKAVREKWLISPRKKRNSFFSKEARISRFEDQILELLEVPPKSEAQRKEQIKAIRQIILYIRQIRRS